MMVPLIEITKLEKTRQDAERTFRLFVPHFTLFEGERVALVGPSGCGKSTFVDLLALALKPDKLNAFMLRNSATNRTLNIANLWDNDRFISTVRARYYGYVQQMGGLLGFLSVRANINLGLQLAEVEAPNAVMQLAERLGVSELLEAKPSTLSVGQRQRVTIARALVHNPAVVLADEPTASLDLENAERVLALLCEISEELGVALVLATHNPGMAEKFGFRLIPALVENDEAGQITSFQKED